VQLTHPDLADGQGCSNSFNPQTTYREKTMNIEMLLLNKLVPSPVNVRKTGAAQGIEQLAASIAADGLLQNLEVRAHAAWHL
jgi:ParB-like nuclease domain